MSENKESGAEAIPTTELNEAELESVAGGTNGLVDFVKAEYELGKIIIEAVSGS